MAELATGSSDAARPSLEAEGVARTHGESELHANCMSDMRGKYRVVDGAYLVDAVPQFGWKVKKAERFAGLIGDGHFPQDADASTRRGGCHRDDWPTRSC